LYIKSKCQPGNHDLYVKHLKYNNTTILQHIFTYTTHYLPVMLKYGSTATKDKSDYWKHSPSHSHNDVHWRFTFLH